MYTNKKMFNDLLKTVPTIHGLDPMFTIN